MMSTIERMIAAGDRAALAALLADGEEPTPLPELPPSAAHEVVETYQVQVAPGIVITKSRRLIVSGRRPEKGTTQS